MSRDMKKQRIVVALGGNALGKTPEEQLCLVRSTAKQIADLIEKGYQVVVGHGNGPQVGMINSAMEFSSQNGGNTPFMPFAECGSMTQGYIGYHLQQAIRDELEARGIRKDCATVVTQVVVDPKDPGFPFVEDAGRGYRRVVPSPLPKEIVEIGVVEQLVQAGVTVITVGGGGIPVVRTDHGLKGVDAVIDKDRACALLAKELDADSLIILTAVEKVCLHFNKPDQIELSEMSAEECRTYIEAGEFAPGSMLPKVEACMDFVLNSKKMSTALITSLSKAAEALDGRTGTLIRR